MEQINEKKFPSKKETQNEFSFENFDSQAAKPNYPKHWTIKPKQKIK